MIGPRPDDGTVPEAGGLPVPSDLETPVGRLAARRRLEGTLDEAYRILLEEFLDQARAAGGEAEALAHALTLLNRLVGLKVLARRRLVDSCLDAGERSAGFVLGLLASDPEVLERAEGRTSEDAEELVGERLAALGLDRAEAYRAYLESLFDVFRREVRILFLTRRVESPLWPRPPALAAVLALLNRMDLLWVWASEEAIGWVYEYFRARVRDEPG